MFAVSVIVPTLNEEDEIASFLEHVSRLEPGLEVIVADGGSEDGTVAIASDLLHEAQLAKSLGVPFEKIQSMVHIYPTYGDAVRRPAGNAYACKLQNNPLVKLARGLSGKD